MTNERIELIEEQASEWFALMSEGKVAEDDRVAFNRWLAQSSVHKTVYSEFQQLWGAMGELSASDYDVTAVKLKSKPAVSESLLARVKSWLGAGGGFSPYATAMAVLMLALFVGVGLNGKNNKGVVYTSSIAEVRQIELEDGSVLTLSADSSVRVDISDSERVVELIRGQAYFSVKTQYNNSGRKIPFFVRAGETSVEVVGTEFDINLRTQKMLLTVTEGRVKVSSNFSANRSLLLQAGQQVIAVGNSYESLGTARDVDVDLSTGWRNGRLTYRDVNLSEVIDDVTRFYDGEFILSDSGLANLRVTASFGVDQVQDMALLLENLLPVKVSKDSDKIIISPTKL